MKYRSNKRHILFFLLILVAFWILFGKNIHDPGKKYKKRLNLTEISAEIKKIKQQDAVAVSATSDTVSEKHLSYDDLIQKLQSDDICNLDVNMYRTEDKVRALLQGPDVIHADARQDFTILSLFSGGALTAKDSAASPVNQFDWILEYYNGMLLAGYIGDSENLLSRYRNVEKAEQIFRGLEEAFPENAVYSLVRASLMNKLGADREEVRGKLIKAMESPVWDTHRQFIVHRLFRKGFANLAYFYTAVDINAHMPIPVLTEPINFLRDQLANENYEEFIKKAAGFAYTIKPQNIPSQGRWEFYEWDALNYAWSYSILKRVWKVMHPQGEEMTDPKPLKEIMTYYTDEKLAEQSSLADFSMKKNCNKPAMEKFFLQEKKEYMDYLNR